MKKKIIMTVMAVGMISYVGVYGMEPKSKRTRTNLDDKIRLANSILVTALDIQEDNFDDNPSFVSGLTLKKYLINTALEMGANVNLDFSYEKLLHRVIETNINNFEIIDMLVAAGADINGVNQSNETPLYSAINNYRRENTSALIRKLLSLGANINSQNEYLMTPLHKAVLNNNLYSVNTLLEDERINVNLQDHKGNTPLHYAIRDNLVSIVESLLKNNNIDLYIKNRFGQTPEELITPPINYQKSAILDMIQEKKRQKEQYLARLISIQKEIPTNAIAEFL